MRRRLFVLPAARDDIAAAANWYDASGPGLGTTFLDSIEELLQRIAETPQQFPEVQSTCGGDWLDGFRTAFISLRPKSAWMSLR